MEKMVHQARMVDPDAMDPPDKDHDKQLHPKHAKLAPTHQLGHQVIQAREDRLEARDNPDLHPMAETVAHLVLQAHKDHLVNQVHPETRVNQVFPVKSTNSPVKRVLQAQAVNPVRPETTVAMVLLVSQVAMVPQDRTAKVAAQVATVKTAHPVDRVRRANEAHRALATTAHLHVPHPDTSKPSVYAVKQHCQSQRIVDIAMVGCWDNISQPLLLYYFRFAFLLLTVLAISTSSEYHLE